jgi:hypothetical protein
VETFLNLLWFVIACGTICVWRGIWRRRVAPSVREWVALVTFLFLLFPVISLTDDLHEELALAECSTGTKHFLAGAGGAPSQHHVPLCVSAHAAILSSRPAAQFLIVIAMLNPVDARGGISAHSFVASGRAPPQVSL